MHVCFIIGAMNYSGAEKVLSIVASELATREHKVSVILLEDERGSVRTVNGVTTYGAKATGSRISRIINRWKNIRGVIKDIAPDIIVSFGFVCNVNTIPALWGRSTPLVICERNDPQYDPRKASERLARKLLYRFATGYVFQTERVKNYFSTAIRKKSAVIPNPLIDSGIRWNQKESKSSIATVARLDNFQKDHYSMFKAFKCFSELNPDYTLDIYGDGPDKNDYLRVIAEMGLEGKVHLHGKVENPLEKIRESKVFLLTSKFEGMPNALMEALSIGIPCVSTDCGGGGAEELFAMVQAGTLVQVGDVHAIAAALQALVRSSEKQMEYSERGPMINEILSKESVVLLWEEYLFKQVKTEG